ncbi:MAG: hypothetical protein QM638_21795 [Nocardioides sp.]|uniref:hypothetical protein n=1 Tax=Nocardioides sp. TaxID=35761 RepID=UPI0039E4ED52
MAGSSHHVIRDLSRFGRPYWLPPGGWGNGLDDRSWVALVDVTREDVASLLLMTLREADVPGYAAVLRRPWRAPARARGRDLPPRIRLWVGGSSYGTAQTEILRIMPGLVRRYGHRVIS